MKLSTQIQMVVIKWARALVWEVLGVIGTGFVIDGAGMIYRPAGFIVAGLAFIGAAALMSRQAD